MPHDAIVDFDEESTVVGLAALGPESQPIGACALGCL
jgi:hypothetical protein